MKPQQPALAILGYHKIGAPAPGGWETWFYVPEATFIEHLTCLQKHGWEVIDLATLLRGLGQPEELPERAAVLTFDDGYQSMLTATLPCLKRFGFPAILFVPTDYAGKTNSFDTDSEPEEQICNWDELLELHRAGVAIQSHGVTHRAFSKLNVGEQAQEAAGSKRVLEQHLHQPVSLFAYPYGDTGPDPDSASACLRTAGYKAACLYGGGVCRWPMADSYRLPRLPMGPDTDLATALQARP